MTLKQQAVVANGMYERPGRLNFSELFFLEYLLLLHDCFFRAEVVELAHTHTHLMPSLYLFSTSF
jgi:hypothetical protein